MMINMSKCKMPDIFVAIANFGGIRNVVRVLLSFSIRHITNRSYYKLTC